MEEKEKENLDSEETEVKDEETASEEETNQEEAEPAETEEDKLKAKLKESEDKYLRLYAEFDNFRKRSTKEKDSIYSDAVIDTAAEFLEVLDNLEMALKTEVTSDDAKAVKDGVEMVRKKMVEQLEKLKITEIKAVGEEFNSELHDAVMHIEDETVAENTVVEEFRKGYIYNNDRVVRYSMVKVAN